MAKHLPLPPIGRLQPCAYERQHDRLCVLSILHVRDERLQHTNKGTLAVDYNDMNAYLIGAIQALKSQVEEQADVIQRLSQSIPVAAL